VRLGHHLHNAVACPISFCEIWKLLSFTLWFIIVKITNW